MVLRCDEHSHIPKKEKRGRRTHTGAFYFSPSLSLSLIYYNKNELLLCILFFPRRILLHDDYVFQIRGDWHVLAAF